MIVLSGNAGIEIIPIKAIDFFYKSLLPFRFVTNAINEPNWLAP